jgi:hypothetical protein
VLAPDSTPTAANDPGERFPNRCPLQISSSPPVLVPIAGRIFAAATLPEAVRRRLSAHWSSAPAKHCGKHRATAPSAVTDPQKPPPRYRVCVIREQRVRLVRCQRQAFFLLHHYRYAQPGPASSPAPRAASTPPPPPPPHRSPRPLLLTAQTPAHQQSAAHERHVFAANPRRRDATAG